MGIIWWVPKIRVPKSSILIGCSLINHPFRASHMEPGSPEACFPRAIKVPQDPPDDGSEQSEWESKRGVRFILQNMVNKCRCEMK